MHLRHQPQTVAQAAGDHVQGTILADGRAIGPGRNLRSDAVQSAHEDAVRRCDMAHKGDQFLRLSLPRGSIVGFQVHIEEAYGSVAALHIDHLHGVIRGKQRGEQGLGEGL